MNKNITKIKEFAKKNKTKLQIAGLAAASVGLTVAGVAFGLWLGDVKKDGKCTFGFKLAKDRSHILAYAQEQVNLPHHIYYMDMKMDGASDKVLLAKLKEMIEEVLNNGEVVE